MPICGKINKISVNLETDLPEIEVKSENGTIKRINFDKEKFQTFIDVIKNNDKCAKFVYKHSTTDREGLILTDIEY